MNTQEVYMYTMKQVCEKVSMPYETLKFYCNQGLVPDVKRDANNYRVFNDHDVAWIQSLTCLKNCGMSLTEMKAYLALCLKGQSSIPERKVMLSEKRNALLEQIEVLKSAIKYIDWKQEFYDDVLSGRTKYSSNLLPEGNE
jgi:MerR family transcriptional regulator, aldehyde-responsive regulator